MGGAKCFFLRFSTDALVLLTNWGREGLGRYAVGNTAFRDWSFFSWKSILEAEGTAQCSSGSHSVISGELQKILTRPNVEVKFSNVTFKVTFY